MAMKFCLARSRTLDSLALASGALVLLLAPGCIELNGRERGQSSGAPAMLRVNAEPENARVIIDDETVVDGRAIAVQPVELRTGHHLITVEAEGYYPHDLELDLPEGETTVRVSLRRLPP